MYFRCMMHLLNELWAYARSFYDKRIQIKDVGYNTYELLKK
jgi:hypothetical protein